MNSSGVYRRDIRETLKPPNLVLNPARTQAQGKRGHKPTILYFKMDVDVVNGQLGTSAQPVPRARRTYGSKAKAPIVSSDDNGSEPLSSLSSKPFWKEPAGLGSLATSTTTTTYQASDWRQDLARIDQDMPLSDEENDKEPTTAMSSMFRSLHRPTHRSVIPAAFEHSPYFC